MIRASEERILVRIVEKAKKEQKIGNLFIPDDSSATKKEFQIGKVMSVGEKVVSVKPEQYVYTRKYAGLLVEFEDVEYVSLTMNEILAISNILG